MIQKRYFEGRLIGEGEAKAMFSNPESEYEFLAGPGGQPLLSIAEDVKTLDDETRIDFDDPLLSAIVKNVFRGKLGQENLFIIRRRPETENEEVGAFVVIYGVRKREARVEVVKDLKSWKERKAARDAHANECLHRGFRIKPELSRPGDEIETMDGQKYRIAADGSRRKI